METYTHVHIIGDTWTPQRFWTRVFLKEHEVKDYEYESGFIRKLNGKDKEILKGLLEKKI